MNNNKATNESISQKINKKIIDCNQSRKYDNALLLSQGFSQFLLLHAFISQLQFYPLKYCSFRYYMVIRSSCIKTPANK